MKQTELQNTSMNKDGLEDINVNDLNFSTSEILNFLDKNPRFQSTSSSVYKLFKKLMIAKYAVHFNKYESIKQIIGININFPAISLGAITSRHFFGIDEVLIYQFYKRNAEI